MSQLLVETGTDPDGTCRGQRQQERNKSMKTASNLKLLLEKERHGGRCPISAADLADTFIYHLYSFSG